jgi:aryl-alcohol dehydrogenase-like predicted oxidoreductase
MEKCKLLGAGLEVAPLAFGGKVFGWTVDEATVFRLRDAFVDAGFNLIDTADSYSRWVPGHQGGESETIIGRWIARRDRRNDVVIATKVGSDMGLGYKCLRKDSYCARSIAHSVLSSPSPAGPRRP